MDAFVRGWAKTFSRKGMRGVGHRLTVSLATLSLFLLATLEPSLTPYQIVEDRGAAGKAFAWAMGIMSIVSLIDILVNDIMPPHYTLPATADGRLIMFMLLGALHLGMVFAILRGYSWSFWMALHFAICIGCIWISIFDTMHRYVLPRYNLKLSDE